MSDFGASFAMKREDNSTDDFEHLEHELHQREHQQQPLLDISGSPPKTRSNNFANDAMANLLDASIPAGVLDNGESSPQLKPVPATPPPSADSAEFNGALARGGHELQDDLLASVHDQLANPKTASMAFVESERGTGGFGNYGIGHSNADALMFEQEDSEDDNTEPERSEASQTRPAPVVSTFQQQEQQQSGRRNLLDDEDDLLARDESPVPMSTNEPPNSLFAGSNDFMGEIRASKLPQPEKSPELDFVKDEMIVREERREKPSPRAPEADWNVLDDFEHSKPLPPLPQEEDKSLLGAETDEFESEPEPSPARIAPKPPQTKETTCSPSTKEFLANLQPRKSFFVL